MRTKRGSDKVKGRPRKPRDNERWEEFINRIRTGRQGTVFYLRKEAVEMRIPLSELVEVCRGKGLRVKVSESGTTAQAMIVQSKEETEMLDSVREVLERMKTEDPERYTQLYTKLSNGPIGAKLNAY